MKSIKKTLALALSVITLTASLIGCAASDPIDPNAGPAMTKILKSGKLVVGTEAQYAPYEFKDMNAKFVGCDIFLAEKIAAKLGVKLEIMDMDFDGIIPAVKSSQCDIGIAAFTNTPKRALEIDFSDLYETSKQLLIVAAGNADKYATKESLKDQKIGGQKGSIQSDLIKKVFSEGQLFELDKYPSLALEVQNGNIAGFVLDAAVGESMVANSKGALEVSKFTFTAEEASVGKSVVIAKGNEDLVKVINEVIAEVLADGSFQKAYDDAVALAATLGL